MSLITNTTKVEMRELVTPSIQSPANHTLPTWSNAATMPACSQNFGQMVPLRKLRQDIGSRF